MSFKYLFILDMLTLPATHFGRIMVILEFWHFLPIFFLVEQNEHFGELQLFFKNGQISNTLLTTILWIMFVFCIWFYCFSILIVKYRRTSSSVDFLSENLLIHYCKIGPKGLIYSQNVSFLSTNSVFAVQNSCIVMNILNNLIAFC